MTTFTLAGLLRLRQVQEDRAAAELGSAERERVRREEQARHTGERLAGSRLPEEADDRTWLAAAASRLTLCALLEEDTERLAAARELASQRRVEWSLARQGERSVERLEEHHIERTRVADLRSEQLALDEIAGRRNEEER